MSLSKPFFNTASGKSRRNIGHKFSDIVTDEEYRRMHWTRQLEVQRKYDHPYEKGDPGDYDNRIDNWDDPENYEEKQ